MNAFSITLFLQISIVFGTSIPSKKVEKVEKAPIGYGNLYKTIQVQSAQLTEINLEQMGTDHCLKNGLCSLGIEKDDHDSWPQLSLGRSLSNFHKILQQMVHETNLQDKNANMLYPLIHQTVAR